MLKITRGFKVGYGAKIVAEAATPVNFARGLTLIRGANACGKTTLLRTVAGVLVPVTGNVEGFEPMRKNGDIAFLPDKLTFEGHLSPSKILDSKHGVESVAKQMATALNLTETKVERLSHGNTAKLAVAWTIGHPAKVYLLDEPFNGMDEDSMKVFVGECRKMRPEAAFVVSVHGLSWMDDVADQIILFQRIDEWMCFRTEGKGKI